MPPPLSTQEMMQAQGGNNTPSLTPSNPIAPVPTNVPAPISVSDMAQAQGASSTPPPSGTGFVNKVADAGKWVVNAAEKGIEQPLISIAATPVQMFAKAIGAPDPFANMSNTTIPGAKDLSVAPVTPSGMIQKVGQAASLALLAAVPESSGVFGLAKLGAMQGLANSVGAGNAGAITNANWGQLGQDAKMGFLFGGTLGLLGKAAQAWVEIEKAGSMVPNRIAAELALTRPSTVADYYNAAIDNANSAPSLNVPGADALAESKARQFAQLFVKNVIPDAGKARSEAIQATGQSPIVFSPEGSNMPAVVGPNAVAPLRDEINTLMQNTTGHQFSDYATGEGNGSVPINYPGGATTQGINIGEGSITSLPGRGIDLSPADTKLLEYTDTQLQKLQETPTIQMASDVMKNLDGKINWDNAVLGKPDSPVDAFLKQVRGTINHSVVRPASPELATANDSYHAAMDLKNQLADAGGKNFQHADLLMRRVMYGEKDSGAITTLNNLTDAVRQYLPQGEEGLVTHGVLARFSKDAFGDTYSQSGFAQKGSAANDISSIFGYPRAIARMGIKTLQKSLTPDPYQYAMSIAKGEPYSFVPMIHNIDEFLDSPSSAPIINSFKQGLKKMGVSSNNIGKASMGTLKMLLFSNLTQPSSVPSTPMTASQSMSTPQNGPVSMATPPQQPSQNLAAPSQRSLSVATPNMTPPQSGPQFASQARTLGNFGVNMNGRSGLTLS